MGLSIVGIVYQLKHIAQMLTSDAQRVQRLGGGIRHLWLEGEHGFVAPPDGAASKLAYRRGSGFAAGGGVVGEPPQLVQQAVRARGGELLQQTRVGARAPLAQEVAQ